MKKIVFFLQSKCKLEGAQILFLKLSNLLALNVDYDVYYVNNIFDEDIEQLDCERLNVISIDQFDATNFSKAIFFTPINYLGNLLSLISELNDAKICLYDYNSAAINWLCNNLGDMTIKEELVELFESCKACSYLDKTAVLTQNTYDNSEQEVFLPYHLIEDTEPFICSKEIDDNQIRIGFVGNIDKVTISSINFLIDNIISQHLDKDIFIHLVGFANETVKNKFKELSLGQVHIIYTGRLEFEDLKKYLINNVDLVVASGSFAIDSALCGLPVIIPVTNITNINFNQYVWLYDTCDNIIQWDENLFSALNYNSYTLKSIFDAIYNKHLKKDYSKECYDFVINNYSSISIQNRFLSFIESSKLTTKKCLSISIIKERIDDFLKYNKENNKDYNSFIDNNKIVEVPTINNQVKKENLQFFYNIQKSFHKKKIAIIKKYKKCKKLTVGFLVIFNSVFPVRPVFELMLDDDVFDPYIVVVPNIFIPKKEKFFTYNETYSSLSKQYPGHVLHGYTVDNDCYEELKDKFDIVFFCNPYSNLVHKNHNISYFLDKNVLTLYSSYGFAALSFWDEVISTDFYNCLWKACVESESNLQHLKEVEKIHGINGVVTGYIKVDKMASIVPIERKRKCILICPHHTVWGWKNLNISNFMKYKDFFVELPKIFPDIDFIFRPHPLLFSNLKNYMHWSQEDIDNYIDKLLKNTNMTYDTSGEYFDKFVNSDAMIHDCGSFIGEYLYTEKPCCYMMKSEEETLNGLVPLGQQCMNQYYHAFSKDDIINFIQKVVVDEDDPLKEQRIEFVRNELKRNYPHAAETVIKMIKKELKIK